MLPIYIHFLMLATDASICYGPTATRCVLQSELLIGHQQCKYFLLLEEQKIKSSLKFREVTESL